MRRVVHHLKRTFFISLSRFFDFTHAAAYQPLAYGYGGEYIYPCRPLVVRMASAFTLPN